MNNSDLLNTATQAAYAAGKRLRRGARQLRTIHFQDDKDVKLKADIDSEILIRQQLTEDLDLPIIGEEQGGDPSLLEGDEPYWIVDPLDGTYNYLRHNPATCVSIGLWRGIDPILGVIYDFNRKELYSGIVEKGLSINQKPVTSDWATEIQHSVLFTGFPAGRDFSTRALKGFIDQIQHFKKIRMIGSAALALAYVAAGQGDAYFEESINLWDVAAGLALVKAAGGAIQMQPTPNKTLGFNVWATAQSEWIQYS